LEMGFSQTTCPAWPWTDPPHLSLPSN
jgi:hypothetical protein